MRCGSVVAGITAFSARPAAGQPADVARFMYAEDSFKGGGPPAGPGASVPGLVTLPVKGDLKDDVRLIRAVHEARIRAGHEAL